MLALRLPDGDVPTPPSGHATQRNLDWRPGRVYFLTLLEPSRDDRTLALTARSASRQPG